MTAKILIDLKKFWLKNMKKSMTGSDKMIYWLGRGESTFVYGEFCLQNSV